MGSGSADLMQPDAHVIYKLCEIRPCTMLSINIVHRLPRPQETRHQIPNLSPTLEISSSRSSNRRPICYCTVLEPMRLKPQSYSPPCQLHSIGIRVHDDQAMRTCQGHPPLQSHCATSQPLDHHPHPRGQLRNMRPMLRPYAHLFHPSVAVADIGYSPKLQPTRFFPSPIRPINLEHLLLEGYHREKPVPDSSHMD